MKKLIICLVLSFIGLAANAQTTNQKIETKSTQISKIKKQTVEIACGECQFKLEGKSCDLAIRIDGKAYFVDGKSIDDFGDAHSEHGFCNAISTAEATGEIVKNRFKASELKLIPKKH